jgi:hypothetical protein
VYSVTVPPGEMLNVVVQPGPSFDTSIVLVLNGASSCAARVCAAAANTVALGLADTLSYFNRGSQPVSGFIIVDGVLSVGGPYSIRATVAPPPLGEVCDNPIVLDGTGGTPVDGGFTYSQTLSGATNEYGGLVPSCASGTVDGPEKAYAVDTPPGRRTTLVAVPATGVGLSISLLEDALACDAVPRVCIAGVDQTTSTGAAGTELAAVYNVTATPLRTLALIDSNTSSAGSFQLTTRVDTPPPGEICANAAAPITMPGTSSATTVGYFNDYLSGSTNQINCRGGAGADRVHAIEVPGLTRLTATVRPDAGYDPVIDLMTSTASCAGRRSCVTSAGSGAAGVAETVQWNNASSAPQVIFLSVDSTAATAGNYDLQIANAAPPAGDVCGNATTLSPASGTFPDGGMGLVVDAPAAIIGPTYLRDYVVQTARGCLQYGGRERAHAVTLDPGKRIDLFVDSTANIVLNLILGPTSACSDAPTCVDSWDDPNSAALPARVSYTNSAAAPVTLYLVVGLFSANTTASYDIVGYLY